MKGKIFLILIVLSSLGYTQSELNTNSQLEIQTYSNSKVIELGDTLIMKFKVLKNKLKIDEVDVKFKKEGTSNYYQYNDSLGIMILGSSPGKKNIRGSLSFNLKGKKIEKTWSFEYKVKSIFAYIGQSNPVLYRCYDNLLSVNTEDFKYDDIKINCSGCRDLEIKDKVYIARVGNTKKVWIKIFGDGKIIGQQEFNIINLPRSQPYFAGKTYGNKTIHKGLLKEVSVLRAKQFNESIKTTSKVSSFSFFVIKKNKKIDGGKASGQVLTDKMKSIIQTINKGDEVYFKDIYISDNKCKSYPVGDLSFKVM